MTELEEKAVELVKKLAAVEEHSNGRFASNTSVGALSNECCYLMMTDEQRAFEIKPNQIWEDKHGTRVKTVRLDEAGTWTLSHIPPKLSYRHAFENIMKLHWKYIETVTPEPQEKEIKPDATEEEIANFERAQEEMVRELIEESQND